MYVSISDPSQRWKRLENGTLKNKASLWQSTATWNFEEFNKTLIKIKDNDANMFLGAQSDGQVVRKHRKDNAEDNEPGQLWIQGKADPDGYYTLENSKSQNLMLTAISKENLEVKSK